jgi:hypothetical protein
MRQLHAAASLYYAVRAKRPSASRDDQRNGRLLWSCSGSDRPRACWLEGERKNHVPGPAAGASAAHRPTAPRRIPARPNRLEKEWSAQAHLHAAARAPARAKDTPKLCQFCTVRLRAANTRHD